MQPSRDAPAHRKADIKTTLADLRTDDERYKLYARGMQDRVHYHSLAHLHCNLKNPHVWWCSRPDHTWNLLTLMCTKRR